MVPQQENCQQGCHPPRGTVFRTLLPTAQQSGREAVVATGLDHGMRLGCKRFTAQSAFTNHMKCQLQTR